MYVPYVNISHLSHPVWVRGLKPAVSERVNSDNVVAPRVGAWIETNVACDIGRRGCVAPRVGAWIETGMLKVTDGKTLVAPRVGAWIETLGV